MVNGVTGVNLQPNPYGNIRRAGMLKNGRVLYNVVDSNGKDAGKLTVPQKQADTFEKAYNDILVTAPKIQKYVEENSSEDDLRRRRIKTQSIVTLGGTLGAFIPLVLTWNKSVMKKIFSVGLGIFAGLGTGFAAAFISSMPPGTYKFEKASQTLNSLDIQPVIEEKDL